MNTIEIFRIAIESLLINRLRSALTALGIIIGVSAVIGLVSLGRGVETYIAQQFDQLGATLLEVRSSQPESLTRTRIEPLTTIEADALNSPITAPSIADVAISYNLFGAIVNGAQRTQAPIRGVSANYVNVVNWPVRFGTAITPEQNAASGRVAVLGLDVVEALFGGREVNPVGQSVRINQRSFAVVGVLEERDSFITSENNIVLIPVSTAQTRLDNARSRDGGFRVSRIHIQVQSEDLIERARQEITAYLDQAHDVVFSDERDYAIEVDTGLLDIVSEISGLLTIFLVMIASISLLVGGIGIMNIMLVSVTERTREIGLRKAVGAQERDILLQFLIESSVLSLLGGVIGILVGFGAAFIATSAISQLTVTVSLDAVVLAVTVSTLVGVVFGYYPARRAARLSPIDALRYE